MSFLGDIFLGDEIARGKKLDAELKRFNAQKVQAGTMTQEEADARDARLESETAAVWDAQINNDWNQGLDQGYENVTGGIKKTLAAPFNFAFASIPWQLWLAAAVALAWYLGAFNNLKNRFAR